MSRPQSGEKCDAPHEPLFWRRQQVRTVLGRIRRRASAAVSPGTRFHWRALELLDSSGASKLLEAADAGGRKRTARCRLTGSARVWLADSRMYSLLDVDVSRAGSVPSKRRKTILPWRAPGADLIAEARARMDAICPRNGPSVWATLVEKKKLLAWLASWVCAGRDADRLTQGARPAAPPASSAFHRNVLTLLYFFWGRPAQPGSRSALARFLAARWRAH